MIFETRGTSSTRKRRNGSCLKEIYIYIRPFSSIELACAVHQPSPCVRALCETGVLFHMSHFKLHFTLHTWQSSHSTLHTSHCTLHTALFTLHPSQSTLHFTRHSSHSKLHTSQSTLHTSHFSLFKRIFYRKITSPKIEKICWQITIAAWMQPLQYDLQSSAAKDNN